MALSERVQQVLRNRGSETRFFGNVHLFVERAANEALMLTYQRL